MDVEGQDCPPSSVDIKWMMEKPKKYFSVFNTKLYHGDLDHLIVRFTFWKLHRLARQGHPNYDSNPTLL